MDKKLGRNDPCWCGSGKKYKQCHMNPDLEAKKPKPYTPTGKRKFKAKVLSGAGKSGTVFKEASSVSSHPVPKFEKSKHDFQVEVKKDEKPLFNINEPAEKPSKLSKPPTQPEKGFKPTEEDFRKKED